MHKAGMPLESLALRNAASADFSRILHLNQREVAMTSALDVAGLTRLAALSSYFKVAIVEGTVAAFLIALSENADYPNDNYAFFATRYSRFLYIDRIVVDSAFAGRRIGTRLYEDLFAHAKAEGIDTVTLEYNLEPPNPASKLFHDRFGFREIGTQRVMQNTKLVSLQALTLAD